MCGPHQSHNLGHNLGPNHHLVQPGQLLLPGFVDMHVHAPQYRFTGTATDTPLMQWLEDYTFPCEAAMQDPSTARDVYTKAVARLLKHGTTTAMYFGTIHSVANEMLVDVVRGLGQRALVGKVGGGLKNGHQKRCSAHTMSMMREGV